MFFSREKIGIFSNPCYDAFCDMILRGQHEPMEILKRKSFLRTFLILCFIGLAVGVYRGIAEHSPLFLFLSDLFFTEFLVFFAIGVIRLLGNLHAMTSASYSFRMIHKLFRNEPRPTGDAARDDYLQYRESRPHHDDAKILLIIAGIFLVLSLGLIPFT